VTLPALSTYFNFGLDTGAVIL